jgi:hypothetical protein
MDQQRGGVLEMADAHEERRQGTFRQHPIHASQRLMRFESIQPDHPMRRSTEFCSYACGSLAAAVTTARSKLSKFTIGAMDTPEAKPFAPGLFTGLSGCRPVCGWAAK